MKTQTDNPVEKAQVSLPTDTEVRVTRSFRAPRELVFRAFTEPALVQRWLLGPPGWSMPVCEMDLRVGGRFVWRWRNDADGSEFGFSGEFLEVDPPARIVHTEDYDAGDIGGNMDEAGQARVTVELTEVDGITTVTTRVDYGSKSARDAAISTGMTDGMEMSYQLLDTLLAQETA